MTKTPSMDVALERNRTFAETGGYTANMAAHAKRTMTERTP